MAYFSVYPTPSPKKLINYASIEMQAVIINMSHFSKQCFISSSQLELLDTSVRALPNSPFLL